MDDSTPRTALIIGAGPAGLTAALELLRNTHVKPIVLEMSQCAGGISRTVEHKGNRIDIGGHRFFSKSDQIMAWWTDILPIQGRSAGDGHQSHDIFSGVKALDGPHPDQTDRVMLIRKRLSRILFLRRFFDYPITLSVNTIRNLGCGRILRIGLSLIKAKCAPIRQEQSLEHFLINRFGRELYQTFFRDYTEKVWGVTPDRIEPQWGAQRIKGVSITRALVHAGRRLCNGVDPTISQKTVENSLIEQFLYPKLGPGQLWEEVARMIEEQGGKVLYGHQVTGMTLDNQRIVQVSIQRAGQQVDTMQADYVLSSMPVQDLIQGLTADVPQNVLATAQGLQYRDFITVGMLLDRLDVPGQAHVQTPHHVIPDNWIYIQEPDVRVGRVQIFNNWSPYMVSQPNKTWLGLEYFCQEGDDLWEKTDEAMVAFARSELQQIGFITDQDLEEQVVIRVPKAYPAYFGSYPQFKLIRDYLEPVENLYLIGRNGMHRYNNQDHSMLTAMAAVRCIAENKRDTSTIWNVNLEGSYHETK